MEAFKQSIQISDPTVIVVVDTAFKSDDSAQKYYFPNEILEIEGYTMHRKDNAKEKKGGILVYLKDSVIVSQPTSKKLNNLAADFSECMWLDLEIQKKHVLFGAIYRKPCSKAYNDKILREMIKEASKHQKILIVGDFNYPKINWKDFEVNATKYSQEMQFFDCLDNGFLTQHVHEPTRFRGKDKPSTLDLIITENGQTQITGSLNINAPLGAGDHAVLTFNYLVSVECADDPESTASQSLKRNYFKGDYNLLRGLIRDTDWDSLLFNDTENEKSSRNKGVDIDDMLDKFYSKLNKAVSEAIPLGGSKRKDKEPWITKYTLKSTKRKYHAWQRYSKSHPRSYKLYCEYIKQRNKTTKTIRQAKKTMKNDLQKSVRQIQKPSSDTVTAKIIVEETS